MEERAAFSHGDNIIIAGRLDDLLSLVAAGLVIVFNAVRALVFKAGHMFLRVVFIANSGEKPGGFRAVDNLARREEARREVFSRTLHFFCREEVLRTCRGVKNRCDAEC